MQVTLEQLIPLLAEKAGAFPVSFTARTKVKLNKKHRETKEACPYPEVWKVAKVQGWLNCSYANAVEKETGEPYVPGETWHDAALDVNDRLTPFSEDPRTGKLYLRVMRPKTLGKCELEGGLTWEQMAPYLPPPPAKEQVVGFRTYGLEGLVDVTFGGQSYEIIGLASAIVDAERELAESMAAA